MFSSSSARPETIEQSIEKLNRVADNLQARIRDLENSRRHRDGATRELLMMWTTPWVILPFATLVSWVALRVFNK